MEASRTFLDSERVSSPDDMPGFDQHDAQVIQLNPPHAEEGFLNPKRSLYDEALYLGSNALSAAYEQLDSLKLYAHEAIHGEYSEKFRTEFDERHCFVTEDNVRLTARIFNPEFLDNDEHAIVYSYSLLVPGAHGIEIPTVADIAAHGERTKRAVIAITTDGLAGALPLNQYGSLLDFNKVVARRFEVLRKILPPNKKVIAAGASMGGLMSLALAAASEQEAIQSGHPIDFTHAITVASAGHYKNELRDAPHILKQFMIDEPIASCGYVVQGKSVKQKLQRFFELVGTVPHSVEQCASVACLAVGLLVHPVEDVESQIPNDVRVSEAVYSLDPVTKSKMRMMKREASKHPNRKLILLEGRHMNILSHGREFTVSELEEIPTIASL